MINNPRCCWSRRQIPRSVQNEVCFQAHCWFWNRIRYEKSNPNELYFKPHPESDADGRLSSGFRGNNRFWWTVRRCMNIRVKPPSWIPAFLLWNRPVHHRMSWTFLPLHLVGDVSRARHFISVRIFFISRRRNQKFVGFECQCNRVEIIKYKIVAHTQSQVGRQIGCVVFEFE